MTYWPDPERAERGRVLRFAVTAAIAAGPSLLACACGLWAATTLFVMIAK